MSPTSPAARCVSKALTGCEPVARRQDLEVLGRVVEHLLDAPVLQERPERREVGDRRRVDERDVVAAQADLDEPEAGVVGPLPDELGVEGDRLVAAGALDERLQVRDGVDQGVLAHRRPWTVHPNACVFTTSTGSPATLWSSACRRYGVRTRSASAGLSSMAPS